MVLGALAVGTAAYAYYKHQKHKDKKRSSREYDHEGAPTSLRAVLSMLICGVYKRDASGLQILFAKMDGDHGGRAESYSIRYWDCIVLSPAEESKLGLSFLRRKDTHPNESAPHFVIALRGTMSKVGDLVADMKVAFETLHNTDRFKRCNKLVWEFIKDIRKDHGSEARICLTGHSLGAAIALLVGRHLAIAKSTYIDTHLFNPPLLTVLSILNGKFIPKLEMPRHIRALKLLLPIKPEHIARTMLALSGNHDAIQKEMEEFYKLADWAPNFYLNDSDPICQQYIKYYQKRHQFANSHVPLSSQAFITRLFGKKAKYISVVPSANLHIHRSPSGQCLLQAHSLDQWHADEELHLEERPYRLLPKANAPI